MLAAAAVINGARNGRKSSPRSLYSRSHSGNLSGTSCLRHFDEKRATRPSAGLASSPAAQEAAGMSKTVNRKQAIPKRPKAKLGLPDLDHSRSAVLDSLRSPESKRGYRHAIDEFIQWYCSEPRLSFNKTVVTRYRIHLENRQLAAGT